MEQQRWIQGKEIFFQVMDLLPAERQQRIEELAAGDQELVAFVEGLIRGDGRETATKPYLASIIEPAIPDQVGEYRIVRMLGKGGMGTVYEAVRRGEDFEQRVALKIIQSHVVDKGFEHRFRKERQILSVLEHPHIARFLDGGSSPYGSYFVMEYVDGSTLLEYADHRQLTIRQRVELFLQLCSAVSFSHRHLVVHRDLKPGNVMVNREGQVKLLDFGIAKILEADDADVRPFVQKQTDTGMGPFTPQYVSPEQYLKQAITTATDVYGLGLVLYEFLTGQTAYDFQDRSLIQMDSMVVRDTPPRPSDRFDSLSSGEHSDLAVQLAAARATGVRQIPSLLSGDLDAIVMKALRKEPERRYPSVADLQADLESYLAGRPVEAHADSLAYRVSKFILRFRFEVAAVATVAMLLIALTLVSIISANRLTRSNRQMALERDRAESISTFLVDLFRSASPYRESGGEMSTSDLVRLGTQQIEAQFSNNPEMMARLQSVMGNIHLSLGDLDQAVELNAAAVKEIQALDQPPDDLHVGALLNYADALSALGRFEEADSHYRAAVAIVKAADLSDLCADVYRRWGVSQHNNFSYQLALGNLNSALDCLGLEGDGAKRALIISSKASVLNQSGMFDEAEKLGREALALLTETFGENHPYTIESLNNLSITLDALGDYAGSEEAMRRSLNSTIETLGDDHPSVGTMWNNLAIIRGHRQAHQESIEALLKALEIRVKALGDDHLDTIVTLTNLGYAHDELKQFEVAEAYYRRGLGAASRVLGPDHPQLGFIFNNLSFNMKGQGRTQDAIRFAVRACEQFRSDDTFKMEHAMSLTLLAGSYLADRQLDQALATVDSALGICRGDDNLVSVTAGCLQSKGRILVAMKRSDEAHACLSQSREMFVNKYGVEDSRVAEVDKLLADLDDVVQLEDQP